jgi:hypothetical protein
MAKRHTLTDSFAQRCTQELREDPYLSRSYAEFREEYEYAYNHPAARRFTDAFFEPMRIPPGDLPPYRYVESGVCSL